MSGVLRLSNNVTGRSTIIASASNDQTFTLPAIGGTLLAGGSSLEVIFPSGTEALPGLHVQGDIDTGLYAPAANTLGISTAGSERLRIDSSGNVGIGLTTNIGATLHVDPATDVTTGFGAPLIKVGGANSWGGPGSLYSIGLGYNNGSTVKSPAEIGLVTTSATGVTKGALVFATRDVTTDTAPTERMRIDSSGNVGIGKSSDLFYRLTFQESSGDTGRIGWVSTSGNRKASIDCGNTAAIVFNTGTSDSERMRIDSSGRVGIGTSSITGAAGTKLQIESAGSTRLNISANVASYAAIDFGDSDDRDIGRIEYYNANNAMLFWTNANERMRIDSSGRLLVGTSSSTDDYLFQVDSSTFRTAQFTRYGSDGATIAIGSSRGTQAARTALNNNDYAGLVAFNGYDGSDFQTIARLSAQCDGQAPAPGDSPGRLVFSTTADGASTPTERMRISSSGVTNVQSPDLSNYAFIAQSTGSSGVQRSALFQFPNNSPNDSSSVFWVGVDSTATRGAFYSNGGLANYQSNDSNLCDEREKKNIETLDSTWGCLKRWELQKFHYNEDADTDNKRYGVIAQQIAEHCPEVIADWLKQEAKDAVLDDDGNVVTPAQKEIIRMGVKEQQMYWMAIKALQEAMARIEALEVEVASLRSN